jgi:hypothetical protein
VLSSGMAKPPAPYTDAKFKVIRQPRRAWRIGFDWRNFAILSAIALAALARTLLPPG